MRAIGPSLLQLPFPAVTACGSSCRGRWQHVAAVVTASRQSRTANPVSHRFVEDVHADRVFARAAEKGHPSPAPNPRMVKRILLCLLTILLALPVLSPGHGIARARRDPGADPLVVAIVETGSGLNVLHKEFRVRPGQDLRLPTGIPSAELVRLPSKGSFQQRIDGVRDGPLGNMEPGTLYRVADTRIVGIYTPPGSDTRDITVGRWHGTGVSGAAVGARFGTNPHALLLYVTGVNEQGWQWLAEQDWIDVVSVSSFKVIDSREDKAGACQGARAVRDLVASGRLVFTASGNGDQFEQLLSPAGLAEAYQVGGVDEDGRSFGWPGRGSTRPYETGDRWSFDVADPDSLSGSMEFGGTSGAAPSTAGRAAELVAHARMILRRGTPSRGPLSDGTLTSGELTDLMHHVATPAETAPGSYLIEGYGAFRGSEVASAKRILAGRAEEPARAEEDTLHRAVEAWRTALFEARQC